MYFGLETGIQCGLAVWQGEKERKSDTWEQPESLEQEQSLYRKRLFSRGVPSKKTKAAIR